eukprot:COSAG02_NODE_1162_length_14168_cov_10.478570_1_plen_76_part_00
MNSATYFVSMNPTGTVGMVSKSLVWLASRLEENRGMAPARQRAVHRLIEMTPAEGGGPEATSPRIHMFRILLYRI